MYDSLGKSFSWYDEWKLEDAIPSAVRIEIETSPKDKNETTGKHITRTFLVPVGPTGDVLGEKT